MCIYWLVNCLIWLVHGETKYDILTHNLAPTILNRAIILSFICLPLGSLYIAKQNDFIKLVQHNFLTQNQFLYGNFKSQNIEWLILEVARSPRIQGSWLKSINFKPQKIYQFTMNLLLAGNKYKTEKRGHRHLEVYKTQCYQKNSSSSMRYLVLEVLKYCNLIIFYMKNKKILQSKNVNFTKSRSNTKKNQIRTKTSTLKK